MIDRARPPLDLFPVGTRGDTAGRRDRRILRFSGRLRDPAKLRSIPDYYVTATFPHDEVEREVHKNINATVIIDARYLGKWTKDTKSVDD